MELQFMKMQIFEIGLLILAAYIGGIVARKLKIGEVIGQICGGILVGPHFLELIHRFLEHHEGLKQIFFFKPIYHFYDTAFPEYANILESYHFFVFLFLGLIAFSIGEELHWDRIKEVGGRAAIICVVQGILTWGLLFLGFRLIFMFDIVLSLLLGSIGIATAPALTFLLMNKLKIEGTLKNVLANVIVLDNIMEVLFFSVFLSVGVVLSKGGHLSTLHITGEVAKDLFFAILIGAAIFFILKLTIKKRLPEEIDVKGSDSFLSTVLSEHPTPSVEILLIILGVVSIGVAIVINFNLPFLITAVVAGLLISKMEREKLASTAIGDGVALPHCRISSIRKTTVAIGLLRNPVNWHAPDKKSVDLIFMILTPDAFPE